MIECPNCRNKEIPGALFCRECGAQLIGITGLTTQTIRGKLTNQLPDLQGEQAGVVTPPPPTDVAVSLHIMDTGEIIPLEGRTEFTLGRSAEGQPILPDIDLAPFHAYENGVSRLHASITLGSQQALATDMGSANGTRLNGLRLPPHRPTPIKHGDILTLGKLKIQLLIRR
jgi:pSer/pThr/pTyr-binding forkhead associated (FHA) protein